MMGTAFATKASNTAIYIAGDSTASVYTQECYPRSGWGQVLQNFFDQKYVTVKDQAVSGRSSKSFVVEGYLNEIAKNIRANDYLLLQFGHNDEKSDAARHTDPATTFKTYLTQFIDVARDKGAFPVLLTPVNRNKFDSNGKLVPTHGDYPQAMIELGRELHVPVSDITEKSRVLFETLGAEKTFKLFMNLNPGDNSNYPQGSRDNTHLTVTGATEIAKLVVTGLKEAKLPIVNYLQH
jgi:lysophospholipase L1-like esterase